MKKTITLLMKMLFVTMFFCSFNLNSQNVLPYFPKDEIAEDISTVATELSDPGSALFEFNNDFTIEVDAVAGDPVVISNGNVFFSYTPEDDGLVRIVKKASTVYVFENSVFKGTINSEKHYITFAEITDADAHDNPAQLLQNASFEVTGGPVEEGSSNYKFGDPWLSNVEIPASYGIRLETSDAAVNGEYVVLWRGSGNDNYFTQELSEIKANTTYKIIVRQVAGANANANFNVGLGSDEGELDIATSAIRLGSDYNGTHETTVITPLNLPLDFYFTLRNTAANTASSGNDPLTHIDYIALLEGSSDGTAGVSGFSGSVYFVDAVYAPVQDFDPESGDYYDLTNYIKNPSFEDGGLNNWSNNGMQTQTNNSPADQNWTKDGNTYVERWTGAPNTLPASGISQTIEGLPNGIYKLLANGHSVMQGSDEGTTGTFLYAGSEQTAVNIGKDNYEVENILVVDNSLTIGFKLEGEITSNWAGVDNFRLYYYDIDLEAINDLLLEIIDEAQAILDDENNPSGYNKTELETAIDEGLNVDQNSDEAMVTAINDLNQAISNFHEIVVAVANLKGVLDYAANVSETDYPGKAEFDNVLSDVQAVYDGTDDVTAEELFDAAEELKSAVQAYVLSQSVPADITALLLNPGFDLEPITYTESDGDANGTALIDPRIYDIPGWEEELESAWGRIATTNYGITFDPIPDVLNGTNPPASDKDGNTEGAALKLSGSWGSPAVLTQAVTLPEGRYELSFEVINMAPGLGIGENKFGFVPDGDEENAVFGTKTMFDGEWKRESMRFALEDETTGLISIGFVGVGAGASSNGKLYIDNVRFNSLGDPSDIAELIELTVDGVAVDGFDAATFAYDIELRAKTTAVPLVTATASDEYASIAIVDAEELPGTTTITVTAEDGVTSVDYTLNFTLADLWDIAELTDLAVDGVTVDGFDAATFAYDVELPALTTEIPVVTAEASDEYATIAIVDAEELPGTTTITVTAEDGVTSVDYTLNFTLAILSDVAELTDLAVDGVTVDGFDAATFAYDIELPAETTEIPVVTATASDDNASIAIVDAEELPGTTTITVTAEDGVTSVDYTLNFTLADPIVNIDKLNSDDVVVYPAISANGNFAIDTKGKVAKLTVVDITGRIVYVYENVMQQTITIDAAGIYLFKFEGEGINKVIKIIKTN